ncbi:hypothetical protein SERLA73DRAFT_71076 [Serpula lacrymans var. lacrymans S7.3]|uniref:Uncharacterized protein n=2 Tax=Serpula lacrymans var. lacrymans TaxID=341189 RepID=F8PP43_SERL3|nr:uncharacterized protein SERLADRAFT_435321 [Serpula lacrymans var. lacrymans S7.9]EGO01920.1 hypothetical protein SERLA73DRAFT_71076 [Serpula lacrymans var. lacrymans S7.3]EGO27546.1 hypothetical protein SERLADRAFT_435321 [Serpula lacrymans var. lacrymans S7.9]
MVDLTKEPLSTHELSRMKLIASSPRESVMSSPWSIQRQSVTSTVVPTSAGEGHEASAEAFLSIGFVTPPGTPRQSIFGQPRKSHIEHNERSKPVVPVEVVPDLKRIGLGRIRGPRPPPKAFSLVATMSKLPEVKPLKIRGKKSIDSQSSHSGPGDQ